MRLHDLRHGAATIAPAAGAEMKVVQEMLGHSSITLTSDTYTSVLPEVAREAAEAAARLIPRQKAKRTAGLTSGSHGPKHHLAVTRRPAPTVRTSRSKEI
jgi:integrase-like protein